MITIRQAKHSDVEAIERVRALVRENRLSTPIPRTRVLAALDERGRGWVAESNGEVVGFSMADAVDSAIWALFLLPEWEGRGLGSALLEQAVRWLCGRGHAAIWLSTSPGTRAEGFYEHLGWTRTGRTQSGEIRFELRCTAGGERESRQESRRGWSTS
jgi:GNAT superfamily N-acetyltransferase